MKTMHPAYAQMQAIFQILKKRLCANMDSNYDLSRFIDAQKQDYAIALQKIKNGHKFFALDVVYLSAIQRARKKHNF